MITITGIDDHDPPESVITITGIRILPALISPMQQRPGRFNVG
jgi:hypothetical protein